MNKIIQTLFWFGVILFTIGIFIPTVFLNTAGSSLIIIAFLIWAFKFIIELEVTHKKVYG